MKAEAPDSATENAMAENVATDVGNAMTSDNTMANAANASGSTENGLGNLHGNMTMRSLTRINCPLLKRLATQEECDSVTAQAANLEAGVGAFKGPSAMTVNVPSDVEFAVGAKAEAEEAAASVGGTVKTTLQVPTKIGRYMTATLSGPGFKIAPQGTPERDLGADTNQLWIWQVTPERAGQLSLVLTVSVEAADDAGKRTPIKIANKTVTIDVGVTKADKRRDQISGATKTIEAVTPALDATTKLFYAIAALIGSIAAIYLAIRYFGRKKPDDAADKSGKP